MKISRLTPAHAGSYRAIMLQAYTDEPDAFTATVPERAPLPLEWWAARVSDAPDASERVFGAFVGGRLAGVAGLRFEGRVRTRHKATLFGLFVRPPFRGQGIARALIRAVLACAQATPGMQIVQLGVMESNVAALHLYASCGFAPFGTEPFAARVGERFVAVVHLWRAVDSVAA